MAAMVCVLGMVQLASHLQDAEHLTGPTLGQRHKFFWMVAMCSVYIWRVAGTRRRGEWNKELGLELTLSFSNYRIQFG